MPDWIATPEPLPDSEGSDHKEVMAFMGLAVFYAQSLEGNLVWLASLVNLPESILISEEVLGSASADLQRRTMGQLLHEVRKRVPVPQKLDDELQAALDARNKLIHGFFIRHKDDYETKDGRTTMIGELRDTAELLKSMNEAVAKILLTFCSIAHEMAGPPSAS